MSSLLMYICYDVINVKKVFYVSRFLLVTFYTLIFTTRRYASGV